MLLIILFFILGVGMSDGQDAARAAVAGGQLVGAVGVTVLASSAAGVMTLLIAWPKTVREGAARMLCTVFTSMIFGPFAVVFAAQEWPRLFATARDVARLWHGNPDVGYQILSTPITFVCGLPSWWIWHACSMWFEKRRGKDVGELLADAADDAAKIRKSI